MSTSAVDPKALASAKLRERHIHVRKLRRTVVAIAVALFVTLWGVIFVRLITGHDPVLAAKAQVVATTGSTSSTAGSTSSTSSGSGSTNSGTTSSGTTRSGTTSVTTRQS